MARSFSKISWTVVRLRCIDHTTLIPLVSLRQRTCRPPQRCRNMENLLIIIMPIYMYFAAGNNTDGRHIREEGRRQEYCYNCVRYKYVFIFRYQSMMIVLDLVLLALLVLHLQADNTTKGKPLTIGFCPSISSFNDGNCRCGWFINLRLQRWSKNFPYLAKS